MKLFQCTRCRNTVHFDNFECLQCHSRLAFAPTRLQMLALDPAGDTGELCVNAGNGVCNWIASEGDPNGFCEACRHNQTIPDLSVIGNAARWAKVEAAKRHLFYSLMRWRLPTPTKRENQAKGLAFNFLADMPQADGSVQTVMTGHDSGVITINIAEADDAERERRRESMREPYRTLLGHFRHEIGHYYWDRLVLDGGKVTAFRKVFGDEREDYGASLQRHYLQGPPSDWQARFISAYAAAHPWEDFAETWAHYIHMVDAIETGRAFGMRLQPRTPAAEPLATDLEFDPYGSGDVSDLVRAWTPLTVAINSINRSMGQPDLYPFVMSAAVAEKLKLIHGLIRDPTPWDAS